MDYAVLLCGKSGTGKSKVIGELLETSSAKKGVSTTTRKMRDEDVEGVTYNFDSNEQFEEKMRKDEFYTVSEHFGKKYAFLKTEVDGLANLFDAIPSVALELKQKVPNKNWIIVYLKLSEEERMHRLKGRGSETDEQINLRISEEEKLYEGAEEIADIIVSVEDRKECNGFEFAAKIIAKLFF